MKNVSLKILLTVIFALTTLSCFASENIISSVTISNSKEKANAYELSVDSTKITNYKSKVDENGNIYFDLKNSTLAPEIGTVYDDVVNIDNVIVKQLDKNKVRIYVEGKNARNTELIFVNSLLETKDPTKKVVINRPLSDYQPTNYDYEDDSIQGWDDNSFNFSHLLATFLKSLKEGPLGMILIILSIFAFSAFIIKSLTKKLSLDNEPLIGLNQNLNRSVVEEKNEFEDLSRRNETIRKAQMELSIAHQKYNDYLKTKYSSKPKTLEPDSIKKGIALNQYQKSTKNPYLDQETIKLNPRKENLGIPKREPIQKFTSPYIQRPNKKIEEPRQKQTLKSDNLRFLESVTKIYEQSGRGDLANGLKSSLSKAKQII